MNLPKIDLDAFLTTLTPTCNQFAYSANVYYFIPLFEYGEYNFLEDTFKECKVILEL